MTNFYTIFIASDPESKYLVSATLPVSIGPADEGSKARESTLASRDRFQELWTQDRLGAVLALFEIENKPGAGAVLPDILARFHQHVRSIYYKVAALELAAAAGASFSFGANAENYIRQSVWLTPVSPPLVASWFATIQGSAKRNQKPMAGRPISIDLSRYRRFLERWVKDAAPKEFMQTAIVGAIGKRIGEICDKRFVGASRYVIEELERILNWIDGAAAEFAEKKRASEGFVLPLLVYGEPGVGKEIVATICHLVNQRTMVNTQSRCEIEGALLNRNAADLDDATWKDWAKAVSKTSDREGTVFLDEFNTLAPRFANRLLKFLDKPHQIGVTGQSVRVLFIACSNQKPEDLIASGFNEAVVMRLAAHYVEWPPLRKRPEDIALFVNHYLFDKLKSLSSDVKPYERIDLNGLRLLCELPWPDNYRGLRGLLDDLLANRRRRRLDDKQISFEEVLECVRNRELLQIRVERGEHRGRSVVELVPRLRQE